MGSTELPYIRTKPKIIFFTDFDGTITLKDSASFPLHCIAWIADETANCPWQAMTTWYVSATGTCEDRRFGKRLADNRERQTDNLGYGQEKRRQGNIAVLEGRTSFRYAWALPRFGPIFFAFGGY